MVLPYDRKFNIGRSSEQLFNEELHKIYESLKHLLEIPSNNLATPDAKLHGSLWLNQAKNELNYFNKPSKKWVNVFENKFKIVDRILNNLPPEDPVPGQLWIYNGVLMYFDGTRWNPIKALIQDGSQFSVAAFEDFLILGSLWTSGNAVVDDEATTKWKAYIEQGKLDTEAMSQFVQTNEIWNPLWECPVKDPKEPLPIPPDAKSQLLVPNIDIDRIFFNGIYNEEYEEVSKICIQYPKTKLINNTPSLVHINPGKISNITKRLVKIDRNNPTIGINAFNTEFYGFRKDDIKGKLLLPSDTQDTGDYISTPDGIVLNYNASQNWDYLLAIHYEFSWIKSTGRLTKTNSNDTTTSYYIANWGAPLNVFVEGYDLEHKHFDINNLSQVVNINDETFGLEVSILRSCKHEYGYIRETDLNNRGIIKLLNKYEHPLVFVNGEAIHPSLGDMEINNDKIFIADAQRNMAWCVIELSDLMRDDNMYYIDGIVSSADSDGQPVISFDNTYIEDDHGLVLFVDGLLVKKEHIIRDQVNGHITTPGLIIGQEFILLRDKFHNLYNESDLTPAISVGKVSETLVYMNGYLICNSTAIATVNSKNAVKLTACNGELKLFLLSELDQLTGEWCIYDSYEEDWKPMDVEDITCLKSIAYSYENTLNAIKVNIPHTHSDIFNIYAFNYVNHIDNPLIIRSFWAYDEDNFTITNTYLPETGSLSVWVDGVRQYRVKEYLDGTGFMLPQKVSGKVTYIIEYPEKGATIACKREILTKANIVDSAPNVYRTTEPLYPGRVTIYAGGLRLPKESWIILDNYTLMIKGDNPLLVGSSDNYPVDRILKEDGTIKEFIRDQSDEILVEIRQEFQRVEKTILWEEYNNWDIVIGKYDLPIEILEAADEILVFINGLFTGLRYNLGYRKDKAKGCISILSSSVIEAICSDPLYTYLMSNQEKYLLWKNKTGQNNYVPQIENKITLEWR